MITPIRRPRWEDLNAYVDGALAPARRPAVERAAAADPAVAGEIARLRAMKATLAESLAAPAPAPLLPSMPQAARRPLWAAAAALLLAALLAFALWPEPDAGWLARAEAEHRGWVATELEPSAGAILPAGLAGGPAAYDLSLAGLALAEVRQEADGTYLGWVGSKGCRLGLWVAAAPADAPEVRQGPDLLLAVWRHEGVGYALMATDMDPRRFASLARLLETRTVGAAQVARDSGSLTLPCLA